MTLRSRLQIEISAANPERRAALIALACGALSALFLYGAVRTSGETGDSGAGSLRSTWLDGRVSAKATRGETNTTWKETSASKRESSDVTSTVEATKETKQRTRTEDLGISFPSHGMLAEELAMRRALSELEAGEAARSDRANALAGSCTSGCEEGADALDAQSAFARDRMAEGRARLVSRTETIDRMARSLEFIED